MEYASASNENPSMRDTLREEVAVDPPIATRFFEEQKSLSIHAESLIDYNLQLQSHLTSIAIRLLGKTNGPSDSGKVVEAPAPRPSEESIFNAAIKNTHETSEKLAQLERITDHNNELACFILGELVA